MNKRTAGIAFYVATAGVFTGATALMDYRSTHDPVVIELQQTVKGKDCIVDHAFLQAWKPGHRQTVGKGSDGMCVVNNPPSPSA
jgi:hypothetical protein